MPKITLQRSAELEFEWPRPDGSTGHVVIPPVTMGQYRRALALEAETPPHESAPDAQERLLRQARVLVGEASAFFLDELDPEMLIEVIQSLLAIHSGLDPAAVLDLQRSLKKKTLLDHLYPPGSSSESATS